ncbi:MAG: Ku protein [Solirubrobacteraceae bacterium]|nr:Ku protein [Solirubrobacteraceae bacterium]
MPRAMWTGSLSFGLVNVPVQVISATRDMDVHFHQVRRPSEGSKPERILMKRVADDGEEVAWGELGKGWELDDGSILVLSQDDLDAAAPEKTKTIDIEQFAPQDSIDPILFDHPYWLLPHGEGDGPLRAYRLLVDALKGRDEVGIGRIVMRAREQLVALRERDGLLSLETMRFADEVRDPQNTGAIPGGEATEPEEQEIADAVALIEEMTDDFDPSAYEDRHRQRLLDLIAEKAKTGSVVIPEPEAEPEPQKAPADLMAALQESLNKARGTKKPSRAKAPAADKAKAEA